LFLLHEDTNYMAVTVKHILDALNEEAPFHLAESWDNVGLLVGDRGTEVTGILAGLDATNVLIDEAIDRNANLIITHHPVIFKPLSAIDTAASEGILLTKALTHKISIIGCHTNFDNATIGVSDILGQKLGLKSLTPLVPDSNDPAIGLGRIGSYPQPISGREFLACVARGLELSGVQLAGPLPEKVTTVAVCGGSGSEFAVQAKHAGADAYVTAEIKHNIAIWAAENGFCVVDGTHYATEKPAVNLLVEKLRLRSERGGWNINITESEREVPPSTLITL